ncbi:inositol phosphatase [Thermosipho melanesiensis]|uniref:Inositol-phosphate phosphatase n=2 Tax=Thermosipho melanesiensis TaxID=46541 RepID=A6LM77_THEM4|nr:inositol monophosphatase [Thermosipho melanesiensis]ABR31028.1 Inositol-phosphate phosphatase [Thermosipho melanesiensis BI429]APT74122.1 inositol phosphatase [Thermosipho melanesiensis]OOC36070.1 inositol phosphatase [Thermosipho melanesiensis]OOC36887.1 inositol phosphatase [Thermosipho melanesiensis]OOC37638.1 inositol phosphatase [Thermosipho melanesiensis]
MNRLDVAIEISKHVGFYLMQFWGRASNIEKKENFQDLVTAQDKNSQELIINKIQSHFPNDGFLAEEDMEKNSKNLWIIDPIDGTINYIHGLPSFCISIAYYEDKKPVFGTVYNPFTEELFVGIKDEGAYLNHSRLKVNDINNLNFAVGSLGFTKNFTGKFIEKVENNVQRIRIIGSAAISACYVAANKFDFFITTKANPWDIAAAYIIVTEAGGCVRNFTGNNPKIFEKDSYIFSKPSILETLQNIISEIGGGI